MAKKDDFQKIYDRILGEHILHLREHLNLSQREMSKKMSVQRQQYDKLEKGRTSTLLYTLQSMFNTAEQDLNSVLNAVNAQFLSQTRNLRRTAEQADAQKYYFKELKRRHGNDSGTK